jgi:hypothetical protein
MARGRRLRGARCRIMKMAEEMAGGIRRFMGFVEVLVQFACAVSRGGFAGPLHTQWWC